MFSRSDAPENPEFLGDSGKKPLEQQELRSAAP